MALHILASPPFGLLPAAFVALLLIGAAIILRLWVLSRSGQSRPFVGLPLAALLAGPALAMLYLVVNIQLSDYFIWADLAEMLPPLLFIGLVAVALGSGVTWLLGK